MQSELLGPDIAVEQPAGTNLLGNGTSAFGTATAGTLKVDPLLVSVMTSQLVAVESAIAAGEDPAARVRNDGAETSRMIQFAVGKERRGERGGREAALGRRQKGAGRERQKQDQSAARKSHNRRCGDEKTLTSGGA